MQPQETFAIYTLIYVWKLYFQLLIVTYIIIQTFFLKTGNSFINRLLLSNVTCSTERSCSPSDKMWRQGDFKNSNFQTFSEFGKIWKRSLGYSKIPIFHLFHELGKTWKYTQPKTKISKNPNLNLCYGWIGKGYVLI